MNTSDNAEHMAWVREVNAVWRQVGREVRAEFKFSETTTPRYGQILIGTLVKKSAQSNITLEYRAGTLYSWSDASPDVVSTTTEMNAHVGTAPSLSFSILRPRLWSRGSMEIGGERYLVKSSDKDTVKELLEDNEIRQLILETLGHGKLVLENQTLVFTEDSNDRIWSFPFPTVEWKRPISDPQRLKALLRLFEAVLDRLPQAPPLDYTPISGEREDDPLATKARRRLAGRSTYYSEGRVIDLDLEGARLVFQKLDPFVRSDWTMSAPRASLCFIPDPRLWRSWSGPGETHLDEMDFENFAEMLNLGAFRLYSVRVKRFRLIGAVESVRWDYSTGIESEVERFSKRLADALKESSRLREALKQANIDVSIECPGIWVVFAPLKRPVLDCFQIIAEVLLGMPISRDEQDAPA